MLARRVAKVRLEVEGGQRASVVGRGAAGTERGYRWSPRSGVPGDATPALLSTSLHPAAPGACQARAHHERGRTEVDEVRSGRKPEVELLAPPELADVAPAVATVPQEELEADGSVAADASMWAVVLAGGIGSRFWPLSTPERPKQLLSLIGDRPLIAETVGRLAPTIPPERVLVVTSRDIAPAIRAAIPEVPAANMLVEPRPLGTAAAVAWGANEVARRAGPETIVCCVHADLAVGFPDLFREVLRRAS